MELDARNLTLSPGQNVTLEPTSLDDMALRFFNIFGLDVNASLAVLIVAAGCFYLGVLSACVMAGRSSGLRLQILATSPMAFLLTSIIWFPLLNGQLIQTKIAPIDAFFVMAVGKGEIHNQMFLLGVVMLFGAMSLPIYSFAQGMLNMAMSLVRKKTDTQTGQQAAATPADPG